MKEVENNTVFDKKGSIYQIIALVVCMGGLGGSGFLGYSELGSEFAQVKQSSLNTNLFVTEIKNDINMIQRQLLPLVEIVHGLRNDIEELKIENSKINQLIERISRIEAVIEFQRRDRNDR